MKRAALTLALIILGFLIWKLKPQDNPPEQSTAIVANPDHDPLIPSEDFPGDEMLEHYASKESSGKSDLLMLASMIDSAFLIIKNRDTRDYSTNEDLVLFLQGNNSYKTRYLGATSPALNSSGQLIDRWNSPLIVHPVSQKALELRSSGPDKTPYTDDDLTWPDSPRS